MRSVVSLEHVFLRTPDNRVWTQGAFGATFFTRYLAVFSGVTVAARVRSVAQAQPGWQELESADIRLHALPFYHGPLQYLLRRGQLRHACLQAVDPAAALIMRVASPISGLMKPSILAQHHPFGLEVVCDPHDIFGPRGIRHPLRPFLRWHFSRQLRRQCADACAVAYVTERAMQARYPASTQVGVSDVELPPSAFMPQPRTGYRTEGPFRVLLVGSLAQLYKGPDVLLRAMQRCRSNGLELETSFVGDGHYRPHIEALARDLGVMERCRFLGQVASGDGVRTELDRADLFVLPSRTEGLPRAMVEAMARGLPCLGSNVGGIPELLPHECLVPVEDHEALANAIIAMAGSATRRAQESARNLQRAHNYSDERLAARRLVFYRAVHDATVEWRDQRL